MDLVHTTIFGYSSLTIISWVVFGFFVGIIVHTIIHTQVKGGVFNTMLLGILGAIVGGFLSKMFFDVNTATLNVSGFLAAIVGALILALLSRLLFRKNEHIKTQPTDLR